MAAPSRQDKPGLTADADYMLHPDVVRSPVTMEQVIGELVFDANGKRSAVGAGLVVIADWVNANKQPQTMPLHFAFPMDDQRITIVIDTSDETS